MNKRVWLSAVVTSVFSIVAGAAAPAAKQEAAKPTAGDASSEAAYAWFLFVKAVTPANGSLTFETWTEQCQLNPAMAGCPAQSAGGAKVRTLHASALARKATLTAAKPLAATQPGSECNPMSTAPVGGYPPPSNVTASAQFCEEVFVNPPEVSFVNANGLQTLNGQKAYGSTRSNAITFPWTAIEIKADWVPTSSFANPTFTCPDTTNKLYTETINGTCYALVGLHISSKVLPNWLWATFEPASIVTNPNRCDPKLYDTCFDPWGTTSKTPYGKGQTVPQSTQLQSLMASANINKAFSNYYLTGVQTQFVGSKGAAVPLGSSFVEFNAGVAPGQASCITCHRYAYYDGTPVSPEDNFGQAPTGWPGVGYACNQNQNGNCTPLVPNSTSQDFSWMLGLMPADGTGAGKTAKPAAKPKKKAGGK
jgi:hypothetical protein